MGRTAHSGALLARTYDMLDMPGWDRFVHSRPGRRFQQRYRRKRQAKGSAWKRCALVCGGVLLALVGIFFMAVPGPGIPILAVGLALVAQESAAMARLLDRAEIRLRRLWKRFRKR
jgi:hypothetical protein